MSHFLFSLPASFETYQAFGNFMYEHHINGEMYELVDHIINEWMADFVSKKAEGAASTLDGYQWKDVFLPAGTTLRNVYKRKSYLAHVEGRDLRYEGRSVSPAQFVNAVGGSFRNAWRTLWVRYPNDSDWIPALTLRKKAENLRANKSQQEKIRASKST
ncbi:hypothetical protein [Pseudoduganella sp. OTU4001]|uniref:hypothetical protein n=1 Tax=Pseudoduganella sp. OTU4001 TaxID=3043854 RepID=UPI00313D6B2C